MFYAAETKMYPWKNTYSQVKEEDPYDPFDIYGVNTTNKLANKFPHFNISKPGKNNYVVEIALAGFSKEELGVQLEGNTLTVSGSSNKKVDNEREYIVRGIATRNFQRSFKLGEGIKISGAEFHNGILSVYLARVSPEKDKPTKIEIK